MYSNINNHWVLPARQKNASWKLITDIAKAVQGVASKWFEIATLLGIPVDKLNSIKDDCDGTPACLTEIIKVKSFVMIIQCHVVISHILLHVD